MPHSACSPQSAEHPSPAFIRHSIQESGDREGKERELRLRYPHLPRGKRVALLFGLPRFHLPGAPCPFNYFSHRAWELPPRMDSQGNPAPKLKPVALPGVAKTGPVAPNGAPLALSPRPFTPSLPCYPSSNHSLPHSCIPRRPEITSTDQFLAEFSHCQSAEGRPTCGGAGREPSTSLFPLPAPHYIRAPLNPSFLVSHCRPLTMHPFLSCSGFPL